MINRTVGEPLPDCIFYEYEEDTGYRVEFHGNLDTLSTIPLRLDIAIENNILLGDVVQVEIRKNYTAYVAEYRAYALHRFKERIPT